MARSQIGKDGRSPQVDTLRQLFGSLRQWTNNGLRAPHKPLLALWAIGRCLRGEDRLARFDTVYGELLLLLKEFGPHRQKHRPEFPFWRMQRDHVWEIPQRKCVRESPNGEASLRDLRRLNVEAGLPKRIFDTFREHPDNAILIAQELVEAHFPESRHNEILSAVGIDPRPVTELVDDEDYTNEWARRRRRDPNFRTAVLTVYGYRCAVCRFSVRLHNGPLALEAAHIRWHQAGGPDEVRNGLSLCAMHHKLFDGGAFTIVPEFNVIVARSADGRGYREWLGKFDGQPLENQAREPKNLPAADYLKWHGREVFKDPGIIA